MKYFPVLFTRLLMRMFLQLYLVSLSRESDGKCSNAQNFLQRDDTWTPTQLTRHILLLCLDSWNLVRFKFSEKWNVMPWLSYHEGWPLSGISNTSRLSVSPPGRGCRSPNEAQLNIQTNEVRAQNRTQPSHLMLRMLSEIGRNIDYLSSSDTWHHLYWTPAHCSYQVLHFPFFINHSNIQWEYCEGLIL